MFEAKVIADSISWHGVRLTTMQLRYPRFIHAELMTHRVFSRNASSSRAIPVARMLEQVRTAPATPIHWGANQPGMQAHKELEATESLAAKSLWLDAARAAADFAEEMARIGLHKQVANRILEPFQWISVIVTATEWENFYDLRIHPHAQPEIRCLAILMKEAMEGSHPEQLSPGEWHLPYITPSEVFTLDEMTACKVSTARCARVSYLTHDGQAPSITKDLELHDRLVGSVPIHASPAEHQAVAMHDAEFYKNFRGWKQYRSYLENQPFEAS